jgi:hydroxymethylglutaryl-CoA lyase
MNSSEASARAAVRIYEVSPRDGLQNEAAVVPTAAKAELVARLVAAGLPDVEVTSFVRAHWIPQLADAAELVRLLPDAAESRFWGLVPNQVGLERAIESGIAGVATFLSASETHNKKNVNRTVRESLAGVEEVLAAARADGLRTRAYISTVFGCPYEGDVAPAATLAIATRLRAAGAEQIVLSDTTGMGTPVQVERIIRTVIDGGIPLEELAVHFHDTRGTALVNALVAWRIGIGTFDASVAGIGGCPYAPGAAGNLATEDIVYLFEEMGVSTGVDLEALADVGHFAAELLGRELPGRYHQYHRGARARAAARAAR